MTNLRRSHSSSGNIPFLWEHLPGISKPIHDQINKSSFSPLNPSLPPPPCLLSTPLARHAIYVPLPPCPFASVKKTKKKKKMDDQDGPFLAAFMEFTKCRKKEVRKRKSVKEKVMEMRGFSCKYGVGVRQDVTIGIHDGNKSMEVKED